MADRTTAAGAIEPVQPVTPPKRSWGARISRIVWDRDEKTEEERIFVRKLDCYLLGIAMFQYFVKYLSQANVANAYVSGMQEDLGFKGTQYNTLLSMFVAGYTIGQFPGTMLMVKISPSIWLPSCEVAWTVLVMCCAAAKNIPTLYGLRFVIGLLEASAYPGMMWVLGSWYNKHELGKRIVFFQATSAIGTMFSGFLQAAVHKGLNGAHGIPGYKWLFLMDGVVCMPIAVAGYFLIPDHPSKPNKLARWYLTDRDLEIARERMARIQRKDPAGFSLQSFKDGFSSYVPWLFLIPYAFSVVALNSYAYFAIALKALGYSVTARNLIPIGGYGLQVVMAFVYSWTSDALGLRWPVIAFGGTVAFVGSVILACWPASLNAKFAGFFLSFTVTSTNALMLTWANELSSDGPAEHRAITLGFLNTAAYVLNAFVPNLAFPANKAPAYKGVAGYRLTAAFWAIYVLGAFVILFVSNNMVARKAARREAEETLESESSSRVGSPVGDKEGLEVNAEAVAKGQTVAAPATIQA